MTKLLDFSLGGSGWDITSHVIAIVALFVACFAITGYISYRKNVGITRHEDVVLEYNDKTNSYEGKFDLRPFEIIRDVYIKGERNETADIKIGTSSNPTEFHSSTSDLQRNKLVMFMHNPVNSLPNMYFAKHGITFWKTRYVPNNKISITPKFLSSGETPRLKMRSRFIFHTINI